MSENDMAEGACIFYQSLASSDSRVKLLGKDRLKPSNILKFQ